MKKAPHPHLTFNSNQVNKTSSQKHLGIILDESLSFKEHLKTSSVKTNKTLYLLSKLQNLLPRPALITLYKSFIRSYLDYGDHEKLESIQYNASLVITGAIRGTSREHKFKHSFQDSINPLCSCSLDVESTIHYFLHCPLFVKLIINCGIVMNLF